MTVEARAQATSIVEQLSSDSGELAIPANVLAPLVYDELRRLARHYLRRETPGHSLQPTDVVNEAYLRLVDQRRVNWRGRTHFFAVGAQMMRRVLIDHARRKKQLKRGGDWKRITLIEATTKEALDVEQLLALNEALARLESVDERSARIAEMRFFAGLTIKETAVALDVSTTTVEGDWAHARAWLREELS